MADKPPKKSNATKDVHAVRQLKSGAWQVSLIQSGMWHTCLSERHAHIVANGLNLANAVKRGERSGEETASELDEASVIVARNVVEEWAVNVVKTAAARAREGA